MRFFRLISISLLFAVAKLSPGQCAQQMQNNYITCGSPVCSNSITTHTPWAVGQYGQVFTCGNVTCCQTSFVDCQFIGINCPKSGKFADPKVREKLLELAKGQDVIVSSCQGEYRPLVVALAEQPLLPKSDDDFVPAERRRTLPGLGELDR